MPEKFKVVISGVSGRFPECDDVDTFKEKLFKNDEFITIDDRKWPVGFKHERLGKKLIPDATGKFLNFVGYDQNVFKLAKMFAVSSDISNRKILEPSFEAIVDAGINPYSLSGSNVSVFMSVGINEIEINSYNDNLPSDNLYIIGSAKTMLANRLSYTLNLKGPSFTNHIDPHGGLDSLMMGYRCISEGLVEAAIVGVASNFVDPRLSLSYLGFGMLCPDGVTRPFDEWANGYARSESVVCFFLQRAEEAKRSYGEIVLCDSRYLGYDLPNIINHGEGNLTTSMEQILEANHKSKSDLSEIAFLEMNACGHKELDKIESNVVAKLIAEGRSEPLLVGSIKSHIGHVEAAAGLMGVLKALFVLDSGTVIPNRNLKQPNSDIQAFQTNQLQVVTEKCSLPGNTVAVNSLSLFGTVGLAIIKQHHKAPREQSKTQNEPLPRILLICGREQSDLKKKLTQIEKSPFNAEFVALANDAFRQHMPLHIYRGFTLLPPPFIPVNCIKERGEQNRPVWFIFSGMGSQWTGMGKSLLRLPLFAETIAKCDAVLRQKDINIYHILTSDDPTIFDDIVNAFVGIIAVQIGLYEVIKALGIKADGLIGHSVGENACAYADGCLSLEQAVLASWARGMASKEVKTIKGMMAAVGKGYAEIKDILPEDVQVACHNSTDSCTLTGPARSVESYVQHLKGEGVFARTVNVANIAYHSKYIADVGPRLLQRLKPIIKEPKQRSPKWISTSVPESEWDSTLARFCSAEYHTNNLLSPVLFEEGCKHIPPNAICIEIAPHGLLQAILKRSLHESCTNIPLTSRGKVQDNLNFLLSNIGMLYIAGLEPEVNNLFPAVEYPVPRGTPHLAPCCTWFHQDDGIPYVIQSHPEENLTMSSELIPICVRDDSDLAYLKHHRIDDNVVIPPSFFMFLTLKMFLSGYPHDKLTSSLVVLEDVRLHRSLIFHNTQDIKYASVMIQYGSGNFQVMSQDSERSEDIQVILTGRIHLESRNLADQLPISTTSKDSFIGRKQFYEILERSGYYLGEEFSLVEEIQCHGSMEYSGKITWNGNLVTFLDALMKVQMSADKNENVERVVPTSIQRLEIPVSQYESLEKGTALLYGLDTSSKELVCSGIVMRSLKCKILPKPDARLNSFRFVPYSNPRCQDVLEFLHLCLQITVENLVMSAHNNVSNIVTVFDMTGKYWRVIERIISERDFLKSIVIVDALEKLKSNGVAHVLVITDNVEKLSEIDSLVVNLFVLAISPSTLGSERKYEHYFNRLVQQSFSATQFTLFKKKMQGVMSDRAFSSPGEINVRTSSSFVLSENFNVDDVSRLIETKRDLSGDKRYLYIMDEKVDEKEFDKFVQKQIELDLSVCVLKQGELGSYRNLMKECNAACINETIQSCAQLISKISAGPKRVNCVCFDEIEDIPAGQMYQPTSLQNEDIRGFPDDENFVILGYTGLSRNVLRTHSHLRRNAKGKIFGFSYVATVDSTARREMGLAMTSPTGKPQYDPYLQWPVPSNCSLEQATKMLYTYTQAYKLLVLIPSYRSQHIRTVMINVGTDYLLAEAFIVLSLHKNLEVFITVDSEEDTILFNNRFPEIGYDHISRSNIDLYIQLKKKKSEKKGFDLMVNCLSGLENVETSLKCMAFYSNYIEVGTSNCLESNDMGLAPFLSSISFHVMRKRVSDFLKLPAETRQSMQKFIRNCLEKGVIAPLKFDTESINSMRMKRSYLVGEIKNCGVSTIKFDRNHSYLILAPRLQDSSLVELIEWLIDQGACKFMVALEKFATPSREDYRINRILTHSNVQVLFSPASKFDDRRGASSFLEEIEKLGRLEVIFYLSIKTSGNKISNLNELVSPNVYFVGLASAGLKEFEQRFAKGSPAVLFHCNKPTGLLNVLPRLHELLAPNDNNNAEILHHIPNSESNKDQSTILEDHSIFRDYLPHDMEILNAIGNEGTMEPSFIEMSSLSSRYIYCKGVFPIFALPAVHSMILEPLFKRLHYPVFSATTTSMDSMKEIAHRLYSSLNNIQPTGPITMISETWTLPLALKLRSYAQRDGRRYKIFILEGIPKIWSDRFKRLQSTGAEKFDSICADEIFHFIQKPKKNCWSEFASFENNVRVLVESASSDHRTVENIIQAAKKIKCTLEELSRIQFADELLEHVIWFERGRPSDQTLKLSVASEVIVVNEPTYRGLLDNPEVSRTINKNAEYSWWDYTKPENHQV